MPNVVLGWFTGGSIAENTSTAGSIGFLNLDSGQFPASIDTISIAPVAGVSFTVDPGSWEVTATGAFDYEALTTASLTILVTYVDGSDNGGESLGLNITDVQEAPDGLSLSAAAVNENSAPGTVVATLSGSDPEGGALTYALVSGTGFSVVNNELRVAGALDHEAAGSASVVISVTDAQSSVTQFTRSITINGVNEAPVLLPFAGVTNAIIGENAAAGRQVARVTVSDPDLGDSAGLSLLGTDAALFVLDGMRVRLASGVTLDHAAAPSLNFTVRATDTGGLTADQAFTVTVEDVVTQAGSLQAVLGGNGTAVGLTVALNAEGALLSLGGNAFVLSGQDTLVTADGELAFGAGTTQALATRLFLGIAGRPAGGQEVMGTTDQMSRGGTTADLAQTLLHGAEFTAFVQANSAAQDVDGLSNGEFADLLYTRVLNRAADSGGLSYWTTQLDNGLASRADVATFFAVSSEAQALYANDTRALWVVDAQAFQVRSLYDIALNREPDAGGLAFWRGVLEQGTSIHVVADFIVSSTEFQASVAGMTTGQVVEMFYVNGLERASDTGGKAFWAGLIDQGLADWGDVLVAFSESSEQTGQFTNYLNGTDIFV